MRPYASDLELLERRARYANLPRTTLAERYLREGLLMDEHPGIHFVDGPIGRRPAVVGTGLDVWEVIEVVRDNDGSVEDAAGYLEIDPRLVQAALGYYGSNRAEIDEWIESAREFNEREEAKWRAAQEAAS